MRFADIPTHASLKKRLLYMAHSGRVAHAHLFWGSTGHAVLPMALAFVTYLKCHHPLPEDACGNCKSCLQLHQLSHPDVKFTFPIAAPKTSSETDTTNNNLLSAWRTFVQEQPYGDVVDWSTCVGMADTKPLITKTVVHSIRQYMMIRPLESPYKFNLIWLPEYMHPTAAHALLKTLEEPASHAIFILVSTAPERLLSTMRSRLQTMYIPAFTDQAIAQLIENNYHLSSIELGSIVQLAGGNAHKAYQLIANNPHNFFNPFVNWMRLCYAHDFTKLIKEVEWFQQTSKEEKKYFLTYSLHLIRQIWIVRLSMESLLQVPKEEKQTIEKLGKTLDNEAIWQIQKWINQAYHHIDRNLNAKILFFNLSLKIAQIFQGIRKGKS